MPRAFLIATFAATLMCGTAGAGTVAQPQNSSMTTSSGSSFDFAQDSTFSSNFGMAPGEENAAMTGAIRDANGNLVVTNGMIGSSTGATTSLQGSNQSGVGTSVGPNATAIGNQLNVVVVGQWNTVVVNSTQVNNGNQTATTNTNAATNTNASLNGQLHF